MTLVFFLTIVALFVNFAECLISNEHVDRESNTNIDGTNANERLEKRKRTTSDSPLNIYIDEQNENSGKRERNSSTLRDNPSNVSEGRIIGGSVSEFGRYDYIVQSLGSKACGGVLIADNIVLTAGHCRDGFNKVAIGLYNFNNLYKSPRVERIQVKKEIVHPSYIGDNYYSDFMILVLNEKSRVTPVCLPTIGDSISPSEMLNVIGFGVTQKGGKLSDKMLETNVEYISNERCNSKYKFHTIYPNMMCADSSLQNRDACQGDSGGPLIIKGKSAHEDVAVGIVSWGVGCATYPGVYARITSEIDWIREQVARNGGKMRTDCGSTGTYMNRKRPEEKCSVKDDEKFVVNKGSITCQMIRNDDDVRNRLCPRIHIQSKCPLTCACNLRESQLKLREPQRRLSNKKFKDMLIDSAIKELNTTTAIKELNVTAAIKELNTTTTSHGECQDNVEWRLESTALGCDWVKGQSREICEITSLPDGNLVKDHCPASCDFCSRNGSTNVCILRDDNSVKLHDRDRTCSNWVSKLPIKRCKNYLVRVVCPVTCSCFNS